MQQSWRSPGAMPSSNSWIWCVPALRQTAPPSAGSGLSVQAVTLGIVTWRRQRPSWITSGTATPVGTFRSTKWPSGPDTALTSGEPPPTQVWVDLTDVSFFDSAGVNALFALNNDLAAAECSLGVIAPEESPARRVLDIVQLARLMPLAETSPPHRD